MLALAPAAAVPPLAAQSPATPGTTQRDVVLGRVTTDSGAATSGAEVTVTMGPSRVSRATRTDTAGQYAIAFEAGTGDYLVHVSAPGYRTFRKRVTRPGRDSVFVVNVQLARAVAPQLAAVTVRGRRPRPPRGEESALGGAGAAEAAASGLTGAVPPDLAGDFGALAGTIPGVIVGANGISALGLGGDQTRVTLNGITFPGAGLPRAVESVVRVATSTFDPARGWFGGAQVDAGFGPRPLFGQRSGYLTLDAPALQYTDRVSSRIGQRPTRVQASLGGNGSVDDADRYLYSYGVEGRRSTADAASLLDAAPDLLQRAGVSADSVARLVQVLSGAGIPGTAPGATSLASDDLSLFASIASAPYDWKTYTPSRRTAELVAYGKVSRVQQSLDGASLLTATPAYGGKNVQAVASLQALHSVYFGPRDWLNTTRSAFSTSASRSAPYLRLPGGRVVIASGFQDGVGGVSGLSFGGSSAPDGRLAQWSWETLNETKFYARGQSAHLVKLTAASRLDGFVQDATSQRFGHFAFNSLADLSAGRPARFTRTLSAPTRRGGEWNGFLALGDQWRASPKLQLQYGARLEGNVFTSAPPYNPEVERTFGRRTDGAPNTIHVSPRAGFTWATGTSSSSVVNRLGRFGGAPSGYLRGGVGEFRTLMDPLLLSAATVQTGLPGSLRQINCLGSAAPVPDWRAYADPAAIPTACVAGGGLGPFADVAPDVQLFSPLFTAARSWRANLAYASTVKWLSYAVEGIYSLNRDQRGTVDLNFANRPQFTLPAEGRAVFVPQSSIDAVSGAVSPVEGRLSADFARVTEARSDLRSVGRQLTVTLTPDVGLERGRFVSLAYTLGDSRVFASGFDAPTFGSPTTREWARGPLDVRHAFVLQGGVTAKGVTFSLFGQLASGRPFTPIVGSDVNGDGAANDRAFVFSPVAVAQSGDTSVANGMRRLLTGAPRAVRRCLTRQLGGPAARASCEGPWTAALNARLSFSGRLLRLSRRMNVSVNLANPLGGLDQLLHGDEHLRGWGTAAVPDPMLYVVRGYDRAANRFQYQVNPRFGDTRPASTALRAPFRLTLDVRMDLGRPIGEQQLNKWLRPGRAGRQGVRLDERELRQRYQRNVPDPYGAILQESDSLLLTREQSEQLQHLQRMYRQRVDSVWTELAEYLAGLPDRYAPALAFKRQESAVDSVWELSRLDVRRTLPGVLNPVQLRLLPWPAELLYFRREPMNGVRVFR